MQTKLRHMSRPFGVNSAWLAEIFRNENYELNRCSSERQLADMLTKCFDIGEFEHARRLVGVGTIAEFEDIVKLIRQAILNPSER